MIDIPRRPDNDADFHLTKAEKDTLVVKCILGYSNQAAFALFNPHLTENGKLTKAGQTACRQFFTHPKNIEWLSNYERTLEQYLGDAETNTPEYTPKAELSETRKEEALRNLLSRAMALVESGADLDADSLKTVAEIFKKLGLLKDEEVQIEAPRRYLPVRCAECAYRSFVESCVKNGEVEDTCQSCKALEFAKNNGFIYDPTTLITPKISNFEDEEERPETKHEG